MQEQKTALKSLSHKEFVKVLQSSHNILALLKSRKEFLTTYPNYGPTDKEQYNKVIDNLTSDITNAENFINMIDNSYHITEITEHKATSTPKIVNNG